MSNIAISVENLGKRYRIGKKAAPSSTKHALLQKVATPFRYLVSSLKEPSSDEIIWAIRDIFFQVKRGEVLGIIGRNGSGKSTLLKVLSRITEPTEGKAEIHGRVGSLLEVGTGFHPELTGRENVYLSGTILGMKQAEIGRKFDEIVEFSGVGKFIDTRIKYYSSGMKVRLGFSVAAHLEPEILLVDEVLAVGDVAFQKKCLGKMNDVAREGRTVLFVSHNMAAIQALCTRSLLLDNGKVLFNGSTSEAISTYLRTIEQKAEQKLAERNDRKGRGQIRLINVEISSGNDCLSQNLVTGRPARFEFQLSEICAGVFLEYVDFTIYDSRGQAIVYFNSADQGIGDISDTGLNTKVVCEVDELLLLPGRYRINASVKGNNGIQDHVEAAAFFNIENGIVRGRSILANSQRPGNVCFPHRWVLPTSR